MNIFSDFHHQGLFYSMQILFEKRLGHDLFRPIGMEWFEEGYWKINDELDTAKQYLSLESVPSDGTQPLNALPYESKGYEKNERYYQLRDEHHYALNKAITYDAFKEMPIDIVIASIPQHVEPFKRLAIQKGAKFILQMGNVFSEIDLWKIPNLMTNTIPQNIPSNCNWISYHQEFPLNIFLPTHKKPQKLISSFINVYPKNKGYEDYATLKSMMPDYNFRSYGGQCDDGCITGIDQLAAKMQESAYIFHSKYGGDGYGHILYNAMACGKPVITRISDYKDKLGEELLKDGETCFDLDRNSFEDIKVMIEDRPPFMYEYMSQKAYARFTELVDFGKEAQMIKEFLGDLR